MRAEWAARLLLGLLPAAAAAQPPEWLNLNGEVRARFESLDGQYRALRSGSDQMLALRSLLRAEAAAESASVVLELHDARAYLDDAGTPISTSFVNTFDVLQAYVGVGRGRHAVKVGRFTLDIGSRRFVERNDFRNTINAFTGIHWRTRLGDAAHVDAFYTSPVRKRPIDPRELRDNEFEADDQLTGRHFWGVHYQHPGLPGGIQGDLFVYGLHEEDRSNWPTPDRDVYAPGFRLRRAPDDGAWDFDLEAAFRFGTRRATALAEDHSELDVRAHMLHAELGYTFDHPWRPRIGLEYDLASGDKEPNDGAYQRYERFYGTRRGDLGNTSLHGPLTRSNASVAGVRLSFARARWDGRAHFQWAHLDAAKDAWIQANLRDPTGQSGRFLGHTLDARVRYWLQPARLRLEFGGSVLWFGEFAEQVPGGPDGSRTLYGFTQVTATF